MKNKVICFSWHPGTANSLSPVISRLDKEGKVDSLCAGSDYCKSLFNSQSYETLRGRECSISSVEAMLHRIKPRLVITGVTYEGEKGSDYSLEQAAVIAAKKNKISSLSVIDTWFNYPSFFDDVISGERFRYLPDKVTVIDEFMKKDMINAGFNSDNIVVTGNPFFDKIHDQKNKFKEEDKIRVRNELGINQNSYLFLYASQPLEGYYGRDGSNPRFLGYTEKTVLRDIIDSIKKIKGVDKSLLVKVHPRERKEDLEEIIKNTEVSFQIRLDRNYNPRLAILASDAVLSPFSTMLLESVYCDRPAVSVQPNLEKDDVVLTNKFGITIPCYCKREMDEVLNRLVTDKSYNMAVKDVRDKASCNVNATGNVVSLIYSMLKMEGEP